MVQCGQRMETETCCLCGQELHMLTSVACSENCCKSRGRRKGNSTDFLAAPDICVFATRNRKTFVNALRSRASPFRKADVLYFKKMQRKDMENVGSQKLIFRDSRCTDEEATAKLWAKRLTAYHRLHLKHPSVRESGEAAKTKNLINYDKGTKMTTGTNC